MGELDSVLSYRQLVVESWNPDMARLIIRNNAVNIIILISRILEEDGQVAL